MIICMGTNIRISTMALSVLSEAKVGVVIIGKDYMPSSIVLPYDANVRNAQTAKEQLNKSARQVSKMREIAKKASPELLEKIRTNEISLNKAYEQIKVGEKKSKKSSQGEGTESQVGKDKRIAKLSLGKLSLSEDEIRRIAQRFGCI